MQQPRLSPDTSLSFPWPRLQPRPSVIQPQDGNTTIVGVLQHTWRLASIQGNFLALPAALTLVVLILCSGWRQTWCQHPGGTGSPALPSLPHSTPAHGPSTPGSSAAHAWPWWDVGPHTTAAPALPTMLRGWRVNTEGPVHQTVQSPDLWWSYSVFFNKRESFCRTVPFSLIFWKILRICIGGFYREPGYLRSHSNVAINIIQTLVGFGYVSSLGTSAKLFNIFKTNCWTRSCKYIRCISQGTQYKEKLSLLLSISPSH